MFCLFFRIRVRIHVPEIIKHHLHTRTVYVHLPEPKPKYKEHKYKEEFSHFPQTEYEDYGQSQEEDYPDEWNLNEFYNQQGNDDIEDLMNNSKPEPEEKPVRGRTKPWIYSNNFRHPPGGNKQGPKNQNQGNNDYQAPVSAKLQAQSPRIPKMNQTEAVKPSPIVPVKNNEESGGTVTKGSRNNTDNQHAQTHFYGMGWYQNLRSGSYNHKKLESKPKRFGTRLYFVSREDD